MAQLFISYSTRNVDFARYLRGLLQDAGFDVWMDETKLSAGQSWTDTLEANVTNCAAFVIIMSPEAKASDWVRRERLLAEKLHKPMFPILFSGEAWWDLANIQYEDMRAGVKATLSPRLITALRQVLSGEIPVAEAEPSGTHIPAPAVAQTESRKLEAAMPAETKAGSDTEMWAKISLPNSEGLRGELPAAVPSGDVIQKGDARASTFPIRFPIDPVTGRLMSAQAELRVSAGDFVIAARGERVEVEIPPDSDSRTVIFTLEASPNGKTSGRSRIVIDLIYEARIIAQISVSTVLVERVTAAVPTWTLAGMGYVAPSTGAVSRRAGEIAPGSSARETVLRDAPSVQPSLSAPPVAASQPHDERERSAFGARHAADDADDSEAELPTYEEAEKKAAPLVDFVPQPTTSGYSASRAPMDMPAPFEPMPKRAPRRASATPLRLASLFAALALVFVVVLTISRNNASQPGNLLAGTQFAVPPTGTSDIVEAAAPLNGIAVAPMVNCTGAPGSDLVSILKNVGLKAVLLDKGITTEAAARAVADTNVAAWGVCDRSGLTLTLELLVVPTVSSGYSTPTEITIQTPPDALNQPDSHATRLAQAVTSYAAGTPNYTALAQTFEDLAASATSTDERTALRTLQQNSVALAAQKLASAQSGG